MLFASFQKKTTVKFWGIYFFIFRWFRFFLVLKSAPGLNTIMPNRSTVWHVANEHAHLRRRFKVCDLYSTIGMSAVQGKLKKKSWPIDSNFFFTVNKPFFEIILNIFTRVDKSERHSNLATSKKYLTIFYSGEYPVLFLEFISDKESYSMCYLSLSHSSFTLFKIWYINSDVIRFTFQLF